METTYNYVFGLSTWGQMSSKHGRDIQIPWPSGHENIYTTDNLLEREYRDLAFLNEPTEPFSGRNLFYRG